MTSARTASRRWSPSPELVVKVSCGVMPQLTPWRAAGMAVAPQCTEVTASTSKLHGRNCCSIASRRLWKPASRTGISQSIGQTQVNGVSNARCRRAGRPAGNMPSSYHRVDLSVGQFLLKTHRRPGTIPQPRRPPHTTATGAGLMRSPQPLWLALSRYIGLSLACIPVAMPRRDAPGHSTTQQRGARRAYVAGGEGGADTTPSSKAVVAESARWRSQGQAQCDWRRPRDRRGPGSRPSKVGDGPLHPRV